MRDETGAVYTAFAAFGSVWGVWGSSVAQIQVAAGVGDGQLGLALLCIGAGAMPAMFLAGRAIDRFGPRSVAAMVIVLGLFATTLTRFAVGLASLCVGLAVLGALSGSADVGINALAGRAEALSGARVVARAHGIFSAAVVASSLATAAAVALGASLVVPFLFAAAVCLLAGGRIVVTTRSDLTTPMVRDAPRGQRLDRGTVRALAVLGLLGALAFASENAHQSWSAVFARNELHASSALAALAPALFAGAVSISRLRLSMRHGLRDEVVLRAGAAAAALGAAVIALAPDIGVDAAGLVIAAGGTAVLFPTLLAAGIRVLPETHRARGTSLVSGVSYLGFLLGPAYVGASADLGGLRAAMLAVGVLPLLLAALAGSALRNVLSTGSPRANPCPTDAASPG